VTITSEFFNPKILKSHITVEADVQDRHVKTEADVEVRVRNETCEMCSRMAGGALGFQGVFVGAVEADGVADLVTDLLDDGSFAIDGDDIGTGGGESGGKFFSELAKT
jgi:hypothetical protein